MKVKNGKITITSKIAYIAGFFDGEGCVRIKEANQGGNSFYVIAHLTNSYRPVLDEVQELFGGALRKQERTPNKTIYNWCLSSAEAVDFLKTISPFLKEKKSQAEFAITFHLAKEKLTGSQKRKWAKRLSSMKRKVIGNVYEHPELLTNSDKISSN